MTNELLVIDIISN